jgi:hypothetical protein
LKKRKNGKLTVYATYLLESGLLRIDEIAEKQQVV